MLISDFPVRSSICSGNVYSALYFRYADECQPTRTLSGQSFVKKKKENKNRERRKRNTKRQSRRKSTRRKQFLSTILTRENNAKTCSNLRCWVIETGIEKLEVSSSFPTVVRCTFMKLVRRVMFLLPGLFSLELSTFRIDGGSLTILLIN